MPRNRHFLIDFLILSYFFLYFVLCFWKEIPLYNVGVEVTIQNPSTYIRKTARHVVLSRCYAANFAHIWGGGSIRALRSASVGANRSPLDFVHPYE